MFAATEALLEGAMDWQSFSAAIASGAATAWRAYWDDPRWFQATVSVVAVGVAIYVPSAQRQHANAAAERERRLKGRSVAIAIYPDLLQLRAVMEKALTLIEMEIEQQREYPFERLMEDLTVEIPPVLDSFMKRLWWMGDPTGPTVLQLIAVVRQYNATMGRAFSRVVTGDGVYDGVRMKATVMPHLSLAKKLLLEALTQIGPIHDLGDEKADEASRNKDYVQDGHDSSSPSQRTVRHPRVSVFHPRRR